MMEEHVLQHDLYTSPFLPEIMQRWAENPHYDDMDLSSDELDFLFLELVDESVFDVLNTSVPEALQKWRKATAALIAVNRFRFLGEQRERNLREQLAKEAAGELNSGTQSMSYPQSGESLLLQRSLSPSTLVNITDQSTWYRSYFPSRNNAVDLHASATAPHENCREQSHQTFSEWGMVVRLHEAERVRHTWTTMILELNLAISQNIAHLLKPITSSAEQVIRQMTESASKMSSALRTTINRIQSGLTDALQKLKDLVVKCLAKLDKDSATVKAKKDFSNLFQYSDNLIRELGEGENLTMGHNDLVDSADAGELDASQECATSISKLVSSHLEPKSSEYIPVAFIKDFFGKSNGTSDAPPPLETPSPSLASDLGLN